MTLAAALLFIEGSVQSAEAPSQLKLIFKDYFLVGTAINRAMAMGTPGFRRSAEEVNRDIALTKQQFNQITSENDMKWQIIHPREGADGYNFEPADAFVDFGLKNDLYLAGHTLVWHSQTPNWVFAGTNPPPAAAEDAGEPPRQQRLGRGFTAPRASREELLERMKVHIHTVVGRYKGRVKAWDVVNEAIADGGPESFLRNSLWLQIIGPDFIAQAFEYAHEADPEAILRYNDYGLENPDKRRKLIKLIKSLQEQGVPVHAIGTQAHLNVSNASFDSMDAALTEMATLGLPIHVTELDINSAVGGQRSNGADISQNVTTTQGGLVDNSEQRLAEAYAGVFRAFLKHKNDVEMVTFWGVNDAVSWRRRGQPLLFDGDNLPKPAFDAVARVAAERSSTDK